MSNTLNKPDNLNVSEEHVKPVNMSDKPTNKPKTSTVGERIDEILKFGYENPTFASDIHTLIDTSGERVREAKAKLEALVADEVRASQQNSEHYWIKYYGDQRRYYDGSDGDMPEISELNRHQQLHKDRLAVLSNTKGKE